MNSNSSLELISNSHSELVLYAVRGHEALSQLFQFQLDIDTLGVTQHHTDCLHKSIAFRIREQIWHGTIVKFTDLGANAYRWHLQPAVAILNQQLQSRVYRKMNAVAIACSVLQGLSYELRLTKTYRLREYSVQYQETTWAFIERLLAEEGIHYYFAFSEDKHLLVLSDQLSIPRENTVLYHRTEREDGYLLDWVEYDLQTASSLTCVDYNADAPQDPLQLKCHLAPITHLGELSHQSYPGGYTSYAQAHRLLEYRAANLKQASEFIAARSHYVELKLDHLINLYRAPETDYLITELWHEAQDFSYRNLSNPKAPSYVNYFKAIRAAIFRPAIPKKVLIDGMQKALVQGQAEDTPAVNKNAEIMISFAWDETKTPISARIAQWWAGNGSGVQFLPRVGDQVWVCFVNGDPERPIIYGSSYDASHPPLYDLQNSGIRTGNLENFNELRFEHNEPELMSWHAARDFQVESMRDTLLTAQSVSIQVAEGGAEMQAEDNYAIQAQDFIELRVGKSSIKLTPEKIILTAPTIRLN